MLLSFPQAPSEGKQQLLNSRRVSGRADKRLKGFCLPVLSSSLSCNLWLKSSRNLLDVRIVALTMGLACYSSTAGVLQMA